MVSAAVLALTTVSLDVSTPSWPKTSSPNLVHCGSYSAVSARHPLVTLSEKLLTFYSGDYELHDSRPPLLPLNPSEEDTISKD